MTNPTAEARPSTVFDETSTQVARSYADAILAAAGDQIEDVLTELDAILVDVFEAHPVFALIMDSPTSSVADRDRILDDTFQGRTENTTLNILRVLNRHGRLNLLGLIAAQVRLIWDRKQNRRPVSVRTAYPLDEAQQSQLRDKIASWIHATPILTLTVDPSLIGGLIVQIDDDVFDASIRSRLESLRHRLIERKNYAEIQSR